MNRRGKTASGWTRKDAEVIAIEFLLSLVANTSFWNLVSPRISMDSSFLTFAITYLGIPISATILLFTIYLRRERVREMNRPLPYRGLMDRLVVSERIVVLLYGVDWVADVGYSVFSQDLVGKIEGPYCPKDHCKLVEYVRPSWLGSEIHSWRCADCGALYPRKEDRLGWEPYDAQNYAMKEYRMKKLAEAGPTGGNA